MTKLGRILSIQSHVVYGYVGNKSATFPLQILGFDVDPINSVNFSNHTGYRIVKGNVTTEKHLQDISDGLAANKLDICYSHLLTGFISCSNALLRVVKMTKRLKKMNSSLTYVCDPVLGDNGKLYVSEEHIPIYRNYIIPLADIIIPNQLEMVLITNKKIKCLQDIRQCINILHDIGPKLVVLSSFKPKHSQNLLAIASMYRGNMQEMAVIEFPEIYGSYTGTGDLFSALFLAWLQKTKCLKITLEKSIATMQTVLKNTFDSVEDKNHLTKDLKAAELRLIESKNDIETPFVKIFAQTNKNILKSKNYLNSCK